ncbi:hypothetical protein O181_112669 [Austropuccinia psidii MF-1]|uniref:Uncharacterized protein n=1 Tax=Austropuccinia psidii MF-1 TaxID=1389203 RepID=A0A9Q3K280_9BASI|nr:hypothetical protein [Austropuccinia psidii MF-1]
MSFDNPIYSSTFLKAIKPFTIEEFEELVFGTPATPIKQSMWEWVTSMTPPLTPALANCSFSSTRASSPEEEPPSAALAFYTFINSNYLPKLFVDDPKIFFSSGPASNLQGPNHPALNTYALRPHGRDGRAITFHFK